MSVAKSVREKFIALGGVGAEFKSQAIVELLPEYESKRVIAALCSMSQRKELEVISSEGGINVGGKTVTYKLVRSVKSLVIKSKNVVASEPIELYPIADGPDVESIYKVPPWAASWPHVYAGSSWPEMVSSKPAAVQAVKGAK